MRALIYIEPVVFRDNPEFLLPHVKWVSRIVINNSGDKVEYGFASSRHLCGRLREAMPTCAATPFFEIDQWQLLKPFGFRRDGYSKALYGQGSQAGVAPEGLSPLRQTLQAIKEDFRPDIVFCSSQNSAIETVFSDRRCFFYEQAPLPRIYRKVNMFLDPRGHQVNSVLNSCHDEIRSLSLPRRVRDETLAIWKHHTQAPAGADDKLAALNRFVREARRGRKVAILAMKPPDWLSYEGAYEPIRPEALVAKWASSLPEGWVGIPTFHPTSRFPLALEAPIKASFSNIEFLPEPLSQDTTELLLHIADGLITISSNSAMAACLQGVPAIVTGACAFSKLLGGRIEDLDSVEPKSEDERASLIAFLTHRYCHPAAQFFEEKNYLLSLVKSASSAGTAGPGTIDLKGWSPASVRRFF